MKELNKVEFKKEVEDYLKVLFRKSINEADDQQKFQAVAYAVKDFIVDQWLHTELMRNRMLRQFIICQWSSLQVEL